MSNHAENLRECYLHHNQQLLKELFGQNGLGAIPVPIKYFCQFLLMFLRIFPNRPKSLKWCAGRSDGDRIFQSSQSFNLIYPPLKWL